MRAEVIAIGDELTSGQRIDTNSAWLSQRLAEIGVATIFHTTIGDDLEACSSAFRLAGERADVVVMTGGLGPTADDLTREALSQACHRPLELREDVLVHIQGIFARHNRNMPDRNRVQAMFPNGSSVIDNPHGTAPGIDLAIAGDFVTRYFCLPGVPAEMRQMWVESVRPALLAMGAGRRIIRHHRLKCFGVGESQLEAMLPDLIRRGRSPTVGITVHKATITLRITAEADSDEACQALIEPTIETIRGCLGNLIFGTEDDELQHAVLRLLNAHDKTLSTIEWGTPGLLTNWFRTVSSPAPDRYWGGTTVTAAASNQFQGVGNASASSASAKIITKRLADQTREQFETDFALAVGPVTQVETETETTDGSRRASCPELCLALAHEDGTACHVTTYAGHPDILAERAAKQALNLLRKYLLNLGPADA